MSYSSIQLLPLHRYLEGKITVATCQATWDAIKDWKPAYALHLDREERATKEQAAKIADVSIYEIVDAADQEAIRRACGHLARIPTLGENGRTVRIRRAPCLICVHGNARSPGRWAGDDFPHADGVRH